MSEEGRNKLKLPSTVKGATSAYYSIIGQQGGSINKYRRWTASGVPLLNYYSALIMFNSKGSDVKLGVKIVVFGAVLALIAIFAVILRIWSRHLKRQELALNDWAAIAALVCFRESDQRERVMLMSCSLHAAAFQRSWLRVCVV